MHHTHNLQKYIMSIKKAYRVGITRVSKNDVIRTYTYEYGHISLQSEIY